MKSFHLSCEKPEDLRLRFLAIWREFRRNPASPLLIVVPEFSHATAWKHELLKAGETIFNVTFVTPSHLRLQLTEALGLGEDLLLGREAMRFLLEQIARKHADRSPLWQSLARDARPLLQTMDELENAGYRLDDLPDFPGFRDWLHDWNQIPLGLRGRANLDKTVLALARTNRESFSGAVFFVGLDANHLRFAPTLESALLLYPQKAVLTLSPGVEDEALQFIWQQKVDEWLPNAQNQLESETIDLTTPSASPEFQFYYTPTRGSEIELITRWVREQLSRATSQTRIAVVFPGPTSLASAVMDRLRDDSIPFYTPFPTPLPRDPQVNALLAWCKLQSETPTIPLLLNFWEIAHPFSQFSNWLGMNPPTFDSLRKSLQTAFKKFPSTVCSTLELPPSATRCLSLIQGEYAWPDSASFADFLTSLESNLQAWIGPLESLGLCEFLHKTLLPISELWKAPITKQEFAVFVAQLFERSDSLPSGSPWSPVHLLPPSTASMLQWDALLVAQLNEGDWPSIAHPVSLIGESTRELLNIKAQSVSATAENEFNYSTGLSPLLTDGMRYQIERSRFSQLRQSALTIAFSASHWDEIESHRELYPSEFYRETWNLVQPDHPWNEAIPVALQSLAPSSPLLTPKQTTHFPLAYHERRNTCNGFSEYQFTLKTAPIPAPLSASQAENILRDPATAWFSTFLQVTPMIRNWTLDTVLPMYYGTTLHRWIGQSFEAIRPDGEFTLLPPAAEWQRALLQEIKNSQKQFYSRWTMAPKWWRSEWPRLESIACNFLDGIYRLLNNHPCRYLACEYRLNRPILKSIPGFTPEQLWSGRIDLIALDTPNWDNATQAVILDFKTGRSADDFNEKDLFKSAVHFQLAFYSALARQQHPGDLHTSVAILTRHLQMTPETRSLQPLGPTYDPLWKILAAAWQQGEFGQTLALRKRFGAHSDLPIATLEIPTFQLHSKWANSVPHSSWVHTK